MSRTHREFYNAVLERGREKKRQRRKKRIAILSTALCLLLCVGITLSAVFLRPQEQPSDEFIGSGLIAIEISSIEVLSAIDGSLICRYTEPEKVYTINGVMPDINESAETLLNQLQTADQTKGETADRHLPSYLIAVNERHLDGTPGNRILYLITDDPTLYREEYHFYPASRSAPLIEMLGTLPPDETATQVFCGNTWTTLRCGEREASFMAGDSVTLTELLLNLDYDPEALCKCLPEYTVETEFGSYGLSPTYARCEKGQASLTPGQQKTVEAIIRRQLG